MARNVGGKRFGRILKLVYLVALLRQLGQIVVGRNERHEHKIFTAEWHDKWSKQFAEASPVPHESPSVLYKPLMKTAAWVLKRLALSSKDWFIYIIMYFISVLSRLFIARNTPPISVSEAAAPPIRVMACKADLYSIIITKQLYTCQYTAIDCTIVTLVGDRDWV